MQNRLSERLVGGLIEVLVGLRERSGPLGEAGVAKGRGLKRNGAWRVSVPGFWEQVGGAYEPPRDLRWTSPQGSSLEGARIGEWIRMVGGAYDHLGFQEASNNPELLKK